MLVMHLDYHDKVYVNSRGGGVRMDSCPPLAFEWAARGGQLAPAWALLLPMAQAETTALIIVHNNKHMVIFHENPRSEMCSSHKTFTPLN